MNARTMANKSDENSDDEMSDLSDEENVNENEAIEQIGKHEKIPDIKNFKEKVFQDTVNLLEKNVRFINLIYYLLA